MSVPNQSSGNEFSIGPVAGIPVRFSPWYLLLVGLVFWRTRDLQVGTIVLFCITLSVLLHELGHGLAAKHYGQRPSIVIHAFGGWCERANVSDRRKDFRIVAAGPGMSVALAMGFWAIGQMLPAYTPYYVSLAVNYMAYTNMFWAVFNVLPVIPMDGGRMLQLQLGYHVDQSRADGMSYWIGTIVGGVGAVLGWVWFNSLFMSFFLVMMAYQNYQRTPMHPFDRTFRGTSRYPAARGGSGFELPPTVAAMVGIVVGGFITSSVMLNAKNLPYVAMAPAKMLMGQTPWTAITAPFLHFPLDWGPTLYAIAALWWFGPPVYRALNSNAKFLTLYVGSLLLGSVTATLLSVPLGLTTSYVVGAGAGSTALLVAWARFVPPVPVLPQLQLLPKHLALIIVLGEAALALSGVVTWSWHAHVAGLLFGLLMPPQKLADNVVQLFPQGGQDIVH